MHREHRAKDFFHHALEVRVRRFDDGWLDEVPDAVVAAATGNDFGVFSGLQCSL